MREQIPSYATPGSAGLDLRAAIEAPLVIEPGATHAAQHGQPFEADHQPLAEA